MLLVLTFYDGVVVEVQVEQKEHVQQPQRPTEEEPRRLTYSPREQRRHLRTHTDTQTGELTQGACPGTGADGKRQAHHAQCGQAAEQQPQPVEQEVEVDVVGDEEDDAGTKQAVTLATADRR